MKAFFSLSFSLSLFLLLSCNSEKSKKDRLFSRLSSQESGIDFSNTLELSEKFDVFRYRNYYNGGGVAIGDINNDSLPDIYLTANTQSNRLYLNKGNLQFEDITEKAQVGGNKAWSTGVSMVDVNGDGLLDIYVCNSGNIDGDNKENELFINNGDLGFTEQAQEYGLADAGFSTHAAFLDIDLDGDLDCYLLNNSFRPVGSFGLENVRNERDARGGDKLLLQEDGKFVDISEDAGIFGSVIGFGLGIAVSDVNKDGWPDLYISNDFFERDYLYINKQDGTFEESLTEYLRHSSQFSMGSDMGDLNNDGWPEIFVTDMLPEDDYRLKTTQSFMPYDVQETRFKLDYYNQFMRNSLQLNNADGTFSEIGLYAGVAATDWSWGALIADFDNSGEKEIFITNGIYKDVTDQDFINFLANDERMDAARRGEKINFKEMIEQMPSNKLQNYLFKKNKDQLRYENLAEEWGLGEVSFSNGSAYGDLDNDGDLDLIVNNVNQELYVYRNNTESQANHHYLKVYFQGDKKNVFGVGSKLIAWKDGQQIYYEQFPTRGFQSSMEYSATLGLGEWTSLDSLRVIWPNHQTQLLRKVKVDQKLLLDIKNAQGSYSFPPLELSKDSSQYAWLEPAFKHQENNFVDFDRERLIYHMHSRMGPALAIGDLDADGNDDFFIGGASGQAAQIYLQKAQNFVQVQGIEAFEKDFESEDIDAQLFDADGDGDLDLYVVSGGSEFPDRSGYYIDRFYRNEGSPSQARFVRDRSAIPEINTSGACLEIADFDGDFDLDLFVGSRLVPGKYGQAASSFLLENDGKGNFRDVTSERIPQLSFLGMVSDAVWVDYDQDQALDLIVVGEWMPVTLFKNKGVGFQKVNNPPGLDQSRGLWNSIEKADLNGDGKWDLLLGNLGLNSRFQASVEEPFHLFINDFDENGSLDHIYAHYRKGELTPFALKQDLSAQLVSLKKEFVYFKDYASKNLKDIFGQEELEASLKYQAETFASSYALNLGKGKFDLKALPEAAQFAPIQAFLAEDLDGDGQVEIVLAGNFSATKPELGKYDASYGLILEIQKNGKLSLIPASQSGLSVRGDTRQLGVLKNKNGRKLIVFARNNESPDFFEYPKILP